MDNKNWIWTDEMVLKYVASVMTSEHPYLYNLEHWKKFIQEKEASKQSSKDVRDYEILSCEHPVSKQIHPYYKNTCSEASCKIYSVKRLSDNSVWKIKDKTTHGEIEKFFIGWSGMEVHYTDGSVQRLYAVEKVKQPIPLFTTEDGKEIFSEHTLLWVVNTAWALMNKSVTQKLLWDDRPELNGCFKYFYAKEAAKEYILMNKPCLSLNDVLKLVSKKETPIHKFEYNIIDKEKLKNLAENKINKQ